ncbi:MAG TPA: hypothetical protein VLG27_03865 [Candidatus Saccharimonadia bacterium]|nr:hypothetical protein [Candidatus Saccharimonadia bacterium]
MSKFGFAKTKWFAVMAGLLVGILVLLGIRFFTYKLPDQVHYHANFVLFINGQREEFKGPQYYQEVAVCSSTNAITIPQERAHMHDNINNVIHVHDHAVTWGQFFANLGWTLGPNFITTPDNTIYAQNGTEQLHLMLNGQDYTGLGGLSNTVIKDQDKLLVSYGDISQTQLKQEYGIIPSTAHHYDVTKDPASCSGSEKVTLHDRLTHLF